MLQQSLLLALDGPGSAGKPALLSGSLTLSWGQLLLLLTGEFGRRRDLNPGDAFEALCSLPPHAILRRLRGRLAMGPCPRCPAAQGTASTFSGPGPLGTTGGHFRKTLPSGENPLAAAPPAARGPPNGSPAISMPGLVW